jgi:hypothetical protein
MCNYIPGIDNPVRICVNCLEVVRECPGPKGDFTKPCDAGNGWIHLNTHSHYCNTGLHSESDVTATTEKETGNDNVTR